jgi:spore coat protein U-like protein
MRKFVLGGVAALAFGAPASMAATSVDIPLSGVLSKACEISAFLNGPFDALDLTSTAVQGAESLTVNCNYGGSASVTFTSVNAGALASGANTVPYNLVVSGSPFSGGVSLATPQTWAGFPAVANANQTRSLSIQLANAASVAGTYTDTITAAVTPN